MLSFINDILLTAIRTVVCRDIQNGEITKQDERIKKHRSLEINLTKGYK